ncbi:glycosyltransferase [Candidatus Falkowbacteria bacterium]|jgi:glycosyltransferase involved in cell wall biosynthesis|nr:glycosyltransferase [Candidatus Falkowbacteria bacterium]MBT4432938.1 glycosyltransferase [Candidatus Falkowbacteria bacterium]
MKLNITLPCYNEEKILKKNILTLFNFLNKNIVDDDWQIIIADNNSIDNTKEVTKELEEKFRQIKYLFVPQKGKGVAIKHGWQKYEADIYIFMDADLATDLEALPKLITAIKEEHYDIAVGSRFHKLSNVKRGIIRKIISYSYRVVKKILVRSSVSDIPCGFKAVNREIIKKILPQIKNKEWFFDSELVILAENQNYKIKEIPVKWEDLREKTDKSRVRVISLGFDYFNNILKLRKRLQKKI